MDEQKRQTPVPDAPGWHADPYGRHELRYWDGSQWTGHVSDHDDVGLEWADVPASAGAHPESQAAVAATPALAGAAVSGNGASVGGPSFGSRPESRPEWATTRSGLHALPGRPPPSPHFGGPIEPDAWSEPAPGSRWYQSGWLWAVTIIGALVVIGALVGPILFSGDDGGTKRRAPVTATKPAATPDGYHVITAERYRLAAPTTWSVQTLDAGALEAGAGTSGELTVATDPFTDDTVSAVPYRGVTGDVRQRDQLEAFEQDFRTGVAGAEVVGLQTAGIRVLGRPAARLVATVEGPTGPVRTITTAINTGDGVYQVTVSSTSPERAALLNALILPTFAAR